MRLDPARPWLPARYFIVQDGSLDVAAMRAAAALLVGEHDFRHFCKARMVWQPTP